jgi:hypothetical protein
MPSSSLPCARQEDLSRHQHGFHKDIFGEEEFPYPFEECEKLGVKFSRKDNLGRHLKSGMVEIVTDMKELPTL